MTENVYPERPLLAKPFQLKMEGTDELRVTISEDFGERVWGAWFGELQQTLETCHWEKQPIGTVHVDFSFCRWADPLPLLSLALALADYESNGKKVRLTFPSDCPKNSNEINDKDYRNRTRFLKFLSREGFLELLARQQPVTSPTSFSAIKQSMRNVMLGNNILKEKDLTRLGEVLTPLVFEECTCLPACLLNMRHPSDEEKQSHIDDDDIDRWVERVLDTHIAPVVADKVPAWSQRGLKYRFQLLLRETLHNVAQHAYQDQGLVAVYVRYRQGLLGQAPSTWSVIERIIQREENNQHMALLGSARRYLGFIRTRTGFFEAYVLDAGYGFVNRITENESMKHLRSVTNPFHKVMLAVFRDGYSSKSDRPTAKGGLHLLQQLLEPNQDYLRGRDEDTWWGVTLPLPSSQSDSTPEGRKFTVDCDASRSKVVPIRGFALMARLSWLDPMDQIPSGTWLGMEEEDHRKPLIETLKHGDGDIDSLVGIAVHDWRLSSSPWSNIDEFTDRPVSNLMALPAMNWMKNSIQDRLGELLCAGCLASDGTLWLGEIASHEVMPYLAALRDARRLFKGLAKRPPRYIVMVTRALRACVLERDKSGLYQERRGFTQDFVRNRAASSSPFKWRLADYFRLLRMHDGRRLWEAVGALPPKLQRGKVNGQSTQAGSARGLATPFLNEWVDWHGLCLDGYLDFPGTLTHPICRELYGLNLHRLTALFPNHECRFVPLDNLVESLIVRFRAEQRPTRPSKQPTLKVRIGSVQVTGLTERLNAGTDTLFHFLRHPSGNAAGRYLLPWLAPSQDYKPDQCTDASERDRGFYERIGRTPAIGRDGWKAFHLPHFDHDEHPVYEESPRRSYRTWQDASRSPMKIGHWSYGGHHDLLTINLLLAFDTELDQISIALAGTLGRFIYANLFRVLDIKPEHLNALGKSLHGAIQHDEFRNLLPESIGGQRGLLLFPSHPVTDHVLARLMTWIEDDAKRTEIITRCVPVLPLRRNRGGSGLQLSGLTLERLKSFVPTQENDASPPPPIVFFDDAMVTGRTFIELKSLLHDVGFQDIYSLTMLDRQRLPSSHHVNQQMLRPAGVRDACFWRLDAPALGSPGHCPLCRGLMRVKELAERLTGRELQARADHWQEIWSERNPATEWGDGGLRPIPVELHKSSRKFGIVPKKDSPSGYQQAGGDEYQIQLSNSAGLVAWVTELHSVTARDDLVGRLIEMEDGLSPEAKIQLAASQLLLFFGEFDADLAVEMGYQLITALSEAIEHDRNTSLAAVTLMACGDRFLAEVIRRLVTNSGTDDPAKVSQQVRHANQDFWLVLEFCQLLNINAGLWVPPRYSESVERGAGAPSGSVQDKRDIYKRFYSNLQVGQSNSHSAYLKRLESLPDNTDRDTRSPYLNRAKNSAIDLRNLVSRLDPVWLRGDKCGGNHVKDRFTERRTEIDDLANRLIKAIELAEQDSDENKANDSFQLAKQLSGTLLHEANDIFHALFMPMGIARMKKGGASTMLTELQEAANFAVKGAKIIGCVETSPYRNEAAVQKLKKADMDEAYIFWDSDLHYALDEILSNVKHTEGSPMVCLQDWGHKGEQTTAHLWMHLEIEEQHFILHLWQHEWDEKLAPKVAKEMIKKNCVKAFSQLGGDVTFKSLEGFLQTSIRIPYAHTIEQSTGERS